MDAITVEKNLNIGSMPSRSELQYLSEKGFLNLINVSGVSLFQLYPDTDFSQFKLNEFCFSDVFSMEKKEDKHEGDAGSLYCHKATIDERKAFTSSVSIAVAALQEGTSSFIFCHRGMGRSPAVALAAVYCLDLFERDICSEIVLRLRPQAQLSSVSFSGMQYVAANFLAQ